MKKKTVIQFTNKITILENFFEIFRILYRLVHSRTYYNRLIESSRSAWTGEHPGKTDTSGGQPYLETWNTKHPPQGYTDSQLGIFSFIDSSLLTEIIISSIK